ncbi:MAG TPA: CBS domain-containing protein [Candidatus Limnocylindrales bacterium]|nr:CBS domain-containing protein [Candidatus Limnocylindrales bacterium]
MRCPVCGHDNLEGEDTCANCGASLWTVDTPTQAESFTGRLLGEHLDGLGAPPPATIDVGASVADALERMRDLGTDCLLVVDGERLVGVFTERDAVVKLAGSPVDGVELRAVMTHDPVVLRPDDSLAVAIHKMAVGGFRHIPVVDGHRPLAVVGAADVFAHILSLES